MEAKWMRSYELAVKMRILSGSKNPLLSLKVFDFHTSWYNLFAFPFSHVGPYQRSRPLRLLHPPTLRALLLPLLCLSGQFKRQNGLEAGLESLPQTVQLGCLAHHSRLESRLGCSHKRVQCVEVPRRIFISGKSSLKIWIHKYSSF